MPVAQHPTRRHRAAPGLKIGEDDADAALLDRLPYSSLEIRAAQVARRDAPEDAAAPGDLLHRRNHPGGEVAVAGEDRAHLQRLTHCLPGGSVAPRTRRASA